MMRSNYLVCFSVILSILLIRNVNEVFAHDNGTDNIGRDVPAGLKALHQLQTENGKKL